MHAANALDPIVRRLFGNTNDLIVVQFAKLSSPSDCKLVGQVIVSIPEQNWNADLPMVLISLLKTKFFIVKQL